MVRRDSGGRKYRLAPSRNVGTVSVINSHATYPSVINSSFFGLRKILHDSQ